MNRQSKENKMTENISDSVCKELYCKWRSSDIDRNWRTVRMYLLRGTVKNTCEEIKATIWHAGKMICRMYISSERTSLQKLMKQSNNLKVKKRLTNKTSLHIIVYK